MKKLSILMVIGLVFFLGSCGGGSDESDAEKAERMQKKIMEQAGVSESEYNEMKGEVKELAENAKKIEAEKANETEEDQKTFSDKNIALLGLNITERKIPDSDWEKATALRNEYKALPNEKLRELTPEKIEKMILDAGFTNMDAAKISLQNIADSRENILSINMKIGMLKSTRILDGDEVYEKEMKELGAKINEKGYSVDDLKVMDENIKIATSITEILYRLNH